MPSRRRFLSAAGTAGQLWTLSTEQIATSEGHDDGGFDDDPATTGFGADSNSRYQNSGNGFDHFVTAEGPRFAIDGDTVYFSGGNHPQLRLGDAWRTDLIKTFLDEWETAAPEMNWLRVPAFATGTERNQISLLESPGQFNESGFVILDELIAACAERGIRLVLPLANYWDWNGGVPQYVDWAGDAETRDDFYTDPTTRQWYRDYVTYVLTRENTVTGVEYRSDPTIALWELMNEPRPPDDTTNLIDWVDEMSTLVHDVDDNHLVSAGTGGGSGVELPAWYESIYELDTVDAWSFHVWSDPNHQDEGVSGGKEWIRQHTEAAHSLSMPVYCGEFGWRVDPERSAGDLDTQMAKRNEVFDVWYEQMEAVDTNGAMVWDLRSETEYTLDWNSYAVFPREDTANIVETWSDTLVGKVPEPSLGWYTDADGRIDTASLQHAITDLKAERIDTTLLRAVMSGWQET
jgi:mannan endo-1,4-beta-mannosidase